MNEFFLSGFCHHRTDHLRCYSESELWTMLFVILILPAHLCFQVGSLRKLVLLTNFCFAVQISEVVNSMKDLIDYSRITGTGPMGKLRVMSLLSGYPTCDLSLNHLSALSYQHQNTRHRWLYSCPCLSCRVLGQVFTKTKCFIWLPNTNSIIRRSAAATAATAATTTTDTKLEQWASFHFPGCWHAPCIEQWHAQCK